MVELPALAVDASFGAAYDSTAKGGGERKTFPVTEAASEVSEVVEQLNQRVRELERRVSVLEAAQEPTPALVSTSPRPLEIPTPPLARKGFPPVERPARVVPVLGKAVLAIAGAYLLRAITELGSVPKLPVLFIAILYAFWWLVWAARRPQGQRFASFAYAITSALILSPLLLESTVRFHAISPAVAGTVLVAYVVLGLAISWRRDLQLIPWVGTLVCVVTAFVLIVQTHELVPLTTALLAAALAAEIAACLGHPFAVRVAAAIACDLALALLVVMVSSPEGVGEGFHPGGRAVITALCIALLAIYGGSIGLRVLLQRQRITVFEIVQGLLAFSIGTAGALIATHAAAAPALGALFLLLAAFSYWGALSRFLNKNYSRNRRVCASWAAALLIAGSLLLFPTGLAVPFLSAAAIATAMLYSRNGKISLGLHASFFLVAATALSPLPLYVVDAMALAVPGVPLWPVWMIAMSAALCYCIGSRRQEEKRYRRALWIIPALLLGFTAAALVVTAAVWILPGRLDISPSRLSVVRTVVNCGLALTLGYLAMRFKRVELGWVAYTALGFGTLKLLFEDLRFGNTASLVVSLLFYGSVLVLLPRLTRRNEGEDEGTEVVALEAEVEEPASVSR